MHDTVLSSARSTSNPRRRLGTERDVANYTDGQITVAQLRAARMGRCSGPAFLKIGRKVIYDFDDIDAYLAEHRVNSTRRDVA